MAIFWNILIKTFSIFVSVTIIATLIILFFNLFDNHETSKFSLISGDKNSSNIIAVIDLNGLIIESNDELSKLTNSYIISPLKIKSYLNDLKKSEPKVIIFDINSPGGTVSASNILYKTIKNFKKNNTNTDVIFHSSELLASGAYWVSTSGDYIYANYGSIIGSIGVKGPDWFFYDKPKSISTGIFGERIETENGIKVFSSRAGKSKDIFNPFRKPNIKEQDHLQKMVDEIYYDFVRVVSKERKIENSYIINDIGALIYTSKKAVTLNLIDGETSLDDLIKKIIKEKNLDNYKVIRKPLKKSLLLKQILNNYLYNSNINLTFQCLNLRSSISAILSYESTGC